MRISLRSMRLTAWSSAGEGKPAAMMASKRRTETAPAWATSMGRVLIAQLAEAEQESFLERVQLQRDTEHTVADLDALRRELDTVREQGWSLVNQELDEGLRGLAVPVYRKNQLLGALNISVQAGRNNPEAIKQILLPKLREAATAIADDFGGRLA